MCNMWIAFFDGLHLFTGYNPESLPNQQRKCDLVPGESGVFSSLDLIPGEHYQVHGVEKNVSSASQTPMAQRFSFS